MIFSCNRFAIIPHMCNECKRYIWLESYRRADMWKHDRFIMENICKKCLPKFLDCATLDCIEGCDAAYSKQGIKE